MKRKARGRDLAPEVAPDRVVLGYAASTASCGGRCSGSRRPRRRWPRTRPGSTSALGPGEEVALELAVACCAGDGDPEPPGFDEAARRGRGRPRAAQGRLVPGPRVRRPVRRLGPAGRVGPPHADHRAADRPVSLCRRPLVQHAVRPRRDHHRAGVPLAAARAGPRRARLPGGHPGDRGDPRAGRRAGQDPARDPQRRDGGARRRCRSAGTTAAWTPRRCSCSWPGPTTSGPPTAAFAESIWPNVEAALGWIDEYGDRDGDGFVEYERRAADGLIHQGWKDSDDAVFHADGTPGRRPDRPVRGPGIRLCGPAGRRRRWPRRSGMPDRAADAERPGGRAPRAVRGGVLVRRPGDLRPGPGRREAALPGADLQRRPVPVRAASPTRRGRRGSPAACWTPESFSGWGIRTLGARPRSATTRWATTTARSGRTTTP